MQPYAMWKVFVSKKPLSPKLIAHFLWKESEKSLPFHPLSISHFFLPKSAIHIVHILAIIQITHSSFIGVTDDSVEKHANLPENNKKK